MSGPDEKPPSPNAHPAVELARELIRRTSITPNDAGCQEIIAARLEAAGFHCETMQFGKVTNLWARSGNSSPVLCFAGHTDVVPAGDPDAWAADPFDPQIRDGILFGRGAVDMKGGLAAMIVATEKFLQEQQEFKGSLAFLVTSDEEGPAQDGTRRVIDTLHKRGEFIDWCIIGEPSSDRRPGDVIRIGRRGSLSAVVRIRGVQGHVAYPHLADNPIHRMAKVLAELQSTTWDQGNKHFPPTTFQAVSLASGVGAANVIPPDTQAEFNFRYSTEWTHKALQTAVEAVINSHADDYDIDWHLSGEPFLTGQNELVTAVVSAISEANGVAPELSTGGGTSDGRFIAPGGTEVVELGLINATAHKVNECTRIDHLSELCRLYQAIMKKLLLS